MDDAWTCSAAYAYTLHLEPGSRAWEYLRRNPRYVRDWVRYRRKASHRIAARWGLGALVDPQLDARQVSPVWSIAAPSPVTLVRDETCVQRKRTMVAELFSLWRLAGRKSLRVQVRYLIRRARALMEGEYRALIAAGPTGSRCGREAGHGSRSASHDR